MSRACRICANATGNKDYVFREKMFGWGDAFTYFQCGKCGCLQVVDVPKDLARFYPSNYYSFHSELARNDGLKSQMAGIRDRSILTSTNAVRKLLLRFKSTRADLVSLSHIRLRVIDRILDVGCGRGQLLSYLHRAGFRHLLGIDPFIEKDTHVALGVNVLKQDLNKNNEQFDLIMLHHVFEHVDNPFHVLEQCTRRLAKGGRLLLRFPTVDSEAWERYRENWVQLDVPRHLFLHTRRSLEFLADKCGLVIQQWWCDSAPFQFWASELYRRGEVLAGTDGQMTDPGKHFSKLQLKKFKAEADRVNAQGRGDQVAVLLNLRRQ